MGRGVGDLFCGPMSDGGPTGRGVRRWHAGWFRNVSLCGPQEMRELYELDFDENVTASESEVDYEEESDADNIFDMLQASDDSDADDAVQSVLLSRRLS